MSVGSTAIPPGYFAVFEKNWWLSAYELMTMVGRDGPASGVGLF